MHNKIETVLLLNENPNIDSNQLDSLAKKNNVDTDAAMAELLLSKMVSTVVYIGNSCSMHYKLASAMQGKLAYAIKDFMYREPENKPKFLCLSEAFGESYLHFTSDYPELDLAIIYEEEALVNKMFNLHVSVGDLDILEQEVLDTLEVMKYCLDEVEYVQ